MAKKKEIKNNNGNICFYYFNELRAQTLFIPYREI